MQVIKQLRTKSNNAHRTITLLKNDYGEYVFCLSTERLIDRKRREIARYKILYTVETFYTMLHLMNLFTDNNIRRLFPEPIIKETVYQFKNTEIYEKNR